MSTKLNAQELARVKYPTEQTFGGPRFLLTKREGYTVAIREVAQPIADQRDELLEALKQAKAMMTEATSLMANLKGWDAGHASGTLRQGIREVDAALAKCTPEQ